MTQPNHTPRRETFRLDNSQVVVEGSHARIENDDGVEYGFLADETIDALREVDQA